MDLNWIRMNAGGRGFGTGGLFFLNLFYYCCGCFCFLIKWNVEREPPLEFHVHNYICVGRTSPFSSVISAHPIGVEWKISTYCPQQNQKIFKWHACIHSLSQVFIHNQINQRSPREGGRGWGKTTYLLYPETRRWLRIYRVGESSPSSSCVVSQANPSGHDGKNRYRKEKEGESKFQLLLLINYVRLAIWYGGLECIQFSPLISLLALNPYQVICFWKLFLLLLMW